ncbi:TIP41L [Scenedesmus sp. PABB004]|nr:TIP41L [Scenedesmus sp. PABB004]
MSAVQQLYAAAEDAANGKLSDDELLAACEAAGAGISDREAAVAETVLTSKLDADVASEAVEALRRGRGSKRPPPAHTPPLSARGSAPPPSPGVASARGGAARGAAAARAAGRAGRHGGMEPPLARASRVHEESCAVRGWSVRARTAPIIGSAQLDALSGALGGVLTLPEMVFGNSGLALRHDGSGLSLRFDAGDALRAWRADDLPPLKVSMAREWQAARVEEIAKQQAAVLEYDWTYTTSYAGTLEWSPPLLGGPGPGPGGGEGGAAGADGGAGAAAAEQPQQQQQQQQQQQSQQSQQRPLPAWQPSERQIDRRMLMSKDEPILFYAEVPLYESELDDNGVCQLTVKVRVMPRCWLVLLRFWLRVDGCVVRLREVRYFSRLDAQPAVVIRETKHSEGTMAELAAAGAPASAAGYDDADAATAVFSAIAPQCLKRFELHELVLPGGGPDAAADGAAKQA